MPKSKPITSTAVELLFTTLPPAFAVKALAALQSAEYEMTPEALNAFREIAAACFVESVENVRLRNDFSLELM